MKVEFDIMRDFQNGYLSNPETPNILTIEKGIIKEYKLRELTIDVENSIKHDVVDIDFNIKRLYKKFNNKKYQIVFKTPEKDYPIKAAVNISIFSFWYIKLWQGKYWISQKWLYQTLISSIIGGIVGYLIAKFIDA